MSDIRAIAETAVSEVAETKLSETAETVKTDRILADANEAAFGKRELPAQEGSAQEFSAGELPEQEQSEMNETAERETRSETDSRPVIERANDYIGNNESLNSEIRSPSAAENKETETQEIQSKTGGAYKDIDYTEKDTGVKERHHCPSFESFKELILSFKDGPAIKMDIEDHRQTAGWGNSKDARAYRGEQAKLIKEGKFREAMQMDIDDIHEKFGNKYDDAISQMTEYVDVLEKEGKLNA